MKLSRDDFVELGKLEHLNVLCLFATNVTDEDSPDLKRCQSLEYLIRGIRRKLSMTVAPGITQLLPLLSSRISRSDQGPPSSYVQMDPCGTS